MATITLNSVGDSITPPMHIPFRVRLSRAGLDRLCELAGVPSIAAELSAAGPALSGLQARLSGARGSAGDTHAMVDVVSLADAALVDAELQQAGLLASPDGSPIAPVASALAAWQHPELAVEFELRARLRTGGVRLLSWHRNAGSWVTCVSSIDGQQFELTWLAAELWRHEIARVPGLSPGLVLETAIVTELPAVICTPWELLLATGEAVRENRNELVAQLVANHPGLTTYTAPSDRNDRPSHTAPLTTATTWQATEWLIALEAQSRGGLQAAVFGDSERGNPGVGLLEWVLHPDGWRRLTPCVDDGWRLVRLERVQPGDLPGQLARLTAQVRG